MKTRVETMGQDELVVGEFQCIYCGRFMREEAAAIQVHEKGHWVHSCIACDFVLHPRARVATLEGRQKRVAAILKIGRPFLMPDGTPIRPYVNREGVESNRPAHDVLPKGK